MPNRSKQKGDRFERAMVEVFRSHGLDTWKVPLSGAVAGFEGDLRVKVGWGDTLTGECKVRKRGFKFLYDNLEGSHFLAVKMDGREPLVVITAKAYAGLLV